MRSASPVRPAGRPWNGSATSGIPGWMPGSSPSRRSTSARTQTTGGIGSRPISSPRAFPASSATGSTRCSRCPRCCGASPRSRRSSATRWSSPRTAARCTRAGATRSSSTMRRTGWAWTSCAGCSRRRDPRTTSCSDGTRPMRRAASCSSCGTSTRSSSPMRDSRDGRPPMARRRRPSGPSWTAGSCHGRPGLPPRSRLVSATTTRSAPHGPCRLTSTGCRPGTCGCHVGASRGPMT